MAIRSRLAVAFSATLLLFMGILTPQVSQAATASDFDPGFIISDEKFFDYTSMSAGDIQAFINSKVPGCNSGYVCLKDFRQNTGNIPADRFCNGYTGGSSENAGEIIFKVAHSCGISPKALIVLIEKESSLITHNGPGSWRYTSATGMGCPDTAPCDPAFNGFFYQVYYGARSFQRYVQDNSSYNYGWNQSESILYNPNRGCGTLDVFIRNSATAALYNYTPYTPNAAAMANLYSTGDACSAYGNRNFWRIYSDWFGNPQETGSPLGHIDSVSALPGSVRMTGWVFDPDTSASIPLHVYINGVGTSVLAANTRTDVGAIWPSVGSEHGFDLTLPISVSGSQNVCLYGINAAGGGSNKLLGCRTVNSFTGDPLGVIDSITQIGPNIKVAGWAFDPDSVNSSILHVYVGSSGYVVNANKSRTDVNSVYPMYSDNYGFSETLIAPGGTYPVCVYAINTAGKGTNKLLGCKTVVSLSGSPFGVVDSVTPEPGYFLVKGWVIDPDTSSSTPVHVYANSTGVAGIADISRPDVANAYPGYGPLHAYSIRVPASPGLNNVCTYGINVAGTGSNRSVACKQVNGLSGDPIGVIDSVTGQSGGIAISGWAYDPDTSGSIPIHIYIDGTGYQINADRSRTDFGAVYPLYGSNHGFSELYPTSPGSHKVCVYGINNAGYGQNKAFGCKTVISN